MFLDSSIRWLLLVSLFLAASIVRPNYITLDVVSSYSRSRNSQSSEGGGGGRPRIAPRKKGLVVKDPAVALIQGFCVSTINGPDSLFGLVLVLSLSCRVVSCHVLLDKIEQM